MAKLIDLTGNEYGRLKVIELASIENYKVRWKCTCVCGKSKIVLSEKLRNGEVQSCGCLRSEKSRERRLKHGQSYYSPEYTAWSGMKERCYNKASGNYYLYGGRGISVCSRWKNSFENFYKDMGNKPTPRHSLDRIDVNGNYEPLNCKWSTMEEQARNKRVSRNNESGYTGVGWSMAAEKWIARIHVDGESKYLGVYDAIGDAIEARRAAEIKYWNKKPS